MHGHRQIVGMTIFLEDLVAAGRTIDDPTQAPHRLDESNCVELVQRCHFACFFRLATASDPVMAPIASRIMRRASVILSPCETQPGMSGHSTIHPPSSRSGS